MDKQSTQHTSLKDISLVAWRADNRHQRDDIRRTNEAFNNRPRLRDDAPVVN